MNFITCLTLSAKPHSFELPTGIAYVNHISQFSTAQELHKERLAAIMKVDTPTFFFQDDDDPLPNFYPDVFDKGLVYGDFIKLESVMDLEPITRCREYDHRWHLKNPEYLHKAFCNTGKAQKIVPQLPQGEYWTELLLYYFLGKEYGAVYDPKLIMPWKVSYQGMHTKAHNSVVNSICWILDHSHEIKI